MMRTRAFAASAGLLLFVPLALAQDTPTPKPAPPMPGEEKPAPAAEAKPATKVERHVNKITAEAKALFEKFDKLVYSPIRAGLKDLSGTVKMEMDFGEGMEEMAAMGGGDLAFSVTFKAPAEVSVAPAGEKEGEAGRNSPMRMMKEGMTQSVRGSVRTMLGLVRPSDEDEYDVEVKTEEGRSVLYYTYFLKGVETSHSAMVLGTNGLPESATVTPKRDPASRRPDGKSSIKFTWAKEGELYRAEKMRVEEPGAPGAMESTFSYADTGGFKVAYQWKMTIAGSPMSCGFRFTDIVVNGKKVDLPKPAAEKAAAPKAPAKGKAGKEEDEDDEDDEKDEGGEKEMK